MILEATLTNLATAFLLIFEKTKEIILEPLKSTDMLWMLIPLVTGMLFIEIYFGHYKKEELGWNSAVSNSLVLFFVGMNLFAYLSNNGLLPDILYIDNVLRISGSEIQIIKSAIAGFVVIEAFLLFILNFTHALPKKFAFGFSSGLYLNFLACISIILVYGSVAINWLVVPAVLLIFFVMTIILTIIELIEPKDWHKD